MSCNIGNFELFLTEKCSVVEDCKYAYYKNKCISILHEIFFGNTILENDANFIEKHTGKTVDEWQKIANDFNFDSRFDNLCECELLDANNMPSAI